ncbi:unnamed protein product [Cylindrotheca closterium]|uniref:Endonuclease n=1 Tax=Cylindrotheca closterium TaxID=2856 RepID=A0AAD2G2S2_9STRA|nr:unnamed protein product [Cylindrotheca closterium]
MQWMMVLARVKRSAPQQKDVCRKLISRLYHHSQAQGNSSSLRRRSFKSPWRTNNAVSLGLSTCLMLGTASVAHYLSSNEQPDSEAEYLLLRNFISGQISEERGFHFFRPILQKGNTSHCEASHHVAHQHQQQHIPSILSPTLPYRILRPNPHLEIAFCTRTRNPIYVLEKDVLYTAMDKDNYHAGTTSGRSFRLGRNRRPNFFEEKSIPTNMRSRPSDYKHSGWDRGHMAPAADFSSNRTIQDKDQKQRIEEQLIKEQMQTYNLCNISPQDASLNRGLWSKLEAWVRTRIVELQEEDAGDSIGRRQVHVLTGPLWMPTHFSNNDHNPSASLEYRYLGIGKPPSLVAVPTHFFKVIVVIAKDEITGNGHIEKFACFVMANRPTQSDTDSETKDDPSVLQDFLVPWSTLETVSGLELFSHLVDDDFRKRADELTLAQVHRRQRQSQSPRTSALELLEAGKGALNNGGRRQHNKGKELAALEHLCKGGKCRV